MSLSVRLFLSISLPVSSVLLQYNTSVNLAVRSTFMYFIMRSLISLPRICSGSENSDIQRGRWWAQPFLALRQINCYCWLWFRGEGKWCWKGFGRNESLKKNMEGVWWDGSKCKSVSLLGFLFFLKQYYWMQQLQSCNAYGDKHQCIFFTGSNL